MASRFLTAFGGIALALTVAPASMAATVSDPFRDFSPFGFSFKAVAVTMINPSNPVFLRSTRHGAAFARHLSSSFALSAIAFAPYLGAPDEAEDMASITLSDYDPRGDLPEASAAESAAAFLDPNTGDTIAGGGFVSAPLPAGALLLLTGLAGFGLLKRPRKTV